MNSEVVQHRATQAEKLQLNMVQVVRTVPLFASLRERDWDEVAAQLTGLCYPREAYIFFEGDAPENLFVIWMGRVKLVRHSVDGRDVVLDVLGPGRLLGEVAVFEGASYSQTAQTMEEVAVIAIPRNDYLDLLQRYPTLALAVINELGRRLRVANDLVQSLAVDRVRTADCPSPASPGYVQRHTQQGWPDDPDAADPPGPGRHDRYDGRNRYPHHEPLS